MKKTILTLSGISILLISTTTLSALPYDSIVQAKSAKYGLDPIFVHALIKQESGHRANVCSHAGACGLMQLMPATAKGLGVTNVYDPAQNVDGGTRFIKSMIKMFNNNAVNGLRAYNWGPGNMQKYLKGIKKTMPKETYDYPIKIEKHYYALGGKGDHFKALGSGGGGTGTNPNVAKNKTILDPNSTCQPVKLPSQVKITYDNIPPPPSLPNPGGGGRVIIDPTKVGQQYQQLVEIGKQIAMLRGKYDSLTKGLAGLNLLTNVGQMAGYELPTTLPSGFDVPVAFGQSGQNVYNSLVEERASSTGVYASKELNASHNQNAQVSNHAYVEAEMAWTQVNCSLNNLKSLAEANQTTESWKQSKDLSNRIAVEKALLEASTGKIQASLIMMNAALQNYSVSMKQAMNKYNK